jgi:serine protease Do
VGNPFGFALSQLDQKYEPTVTVGVISATKRAIQAGGRGERRIYPDLIQTDASINPGNSGGPLVNIYGEVIGINTAILSPTGGSVGIGFAIPINKAKRLLQSLVKYGEIKWPWIGIYMQRLTPELAEKFGVEEGVLVADVIPNSPAEKAGIKPGDVIQEVNGEPVETPFDLKEAILKTEIGEKISLVLVREGKRIEVELVTAPKPEEITVAEVEVEAKLLGIRVAEITPQLGQRYGVDPEEEGVVIIEVEPGGPADRVGISSGDVIKGVNRKKIENLSDFKTAMGQIEPGETILLRLRHGPWTMFVTLKTRG